MTKCGWGVKNKDGAEIWDSDPVFPGDRVSLREKLILLFYPKKFFLYRSVRKHIHALTKRYATIEGGQLYHPKILDVGCGTGAAVIDLKKMFGRSVDVIGVDIVQLQIELAQKKMKEHGVWVDLRHVDGDHLPFDTHSIDVVYTSDVLGHVRDVSAWLTEINRVLKPGGTLAMFAESRLGRHAYIRQYLLRRGLNLDPHAEFHISLYSKNTLKELLQQAGFDVEVMYSTVWAKFFVHPDELYPAFQNHGGFFFFRLVNALLYRLKKITHPFSTALCELYSLVEMLTIGRFVESQGYIILAHKKK